MEGLGHAATTLCQPRQERGYLGVDNRGMCQRAKMAEALQIHNLRSWKQRLEAGDYAAGSERSI